MWDFVGSLSFALPSSISRSLTSAVTCDEKALVVAKGYHLNIFSLDRKSSPPCIIDVARDFVRAIAADHSNPHIVHVGGTSGNLRTYDVNTRKLLRRTMTAHKRTIVTITTTPNDLFLISGAIDNRICVWATIELETDNSPSLTSSSPTSSPASSFAIASPSATPPSSSRVPLSSNDCLPLNLLHTIPFSGTISCIITSHDNLRFYAALSDAVVEYDVRSGTKLREFSFPKENFVDLIITKDDLHLFAAVDDVGVRLFNLRTGTVIRTFELKGVQIRISLSPNEKTLITGVVDYHPTSQLSSNKFFRVDTGELFKTLNSSSIIPIAFCNR